MEPLFGDEIKMPKIAEPEEPTIKLGEKTLSKTQEKIYDAKISAYVKEEKSLDDSMSALLNIIWGQCSAMMQNRLESVSDYESIVADANVASLLKEIRNISNELQVSANIYDALDETKTKYFKYYQDYDESNIKHVKNIKDMIATIEHYGGNVCSDAGLIKYEKTVDGMVTTKKDYDKVVRAKVLGCAIIKRAKIQRYGELLKN